jgi:hypothetical protein
MADLVITAANVAKGSGATTQTLNAGVAITAGQLLYADITVTPNVWRLANATTSGITGAIAAVALNPGAAGQPVVGLIGGLYTAGATLVVGQIYCLSSNGGNICPVSDVAAGWYSCVLGYAQTTTQINVKISNSGVVHG